MIPSRSSGELRIQVETDIVAARRAVRECATRLGFTPTDVTRIVTAASEVARNVFKYAGKGVMRWNHLDSDGRIGIEVQFADQGPGIPNINQAMEVGYSTGGGLGLGLPGAKRLVDELHVESSAGLGTKVTLTKWRRN